MRLTLTLLTTLALGGCFDGLDFSGLFACGYPGETGSFRFGYSDGVIFPKCMSTTEAALPSGGATAVLSVEINRKNASYQSVRSSNPQVVSASKQSGSIMLRSLAAGEARIELLDREERVVDAVTVMVRDAERVDIPGKQAAAVPLLTGAGLRVEVKPARANVTFVGTGAGQASGSGTVVVTHMPSESYQPFELFSNPNKKATELSLRAASVGAGSVDVELAGVKESLAIEVVDVAALDAVAADPPSLTLERNKSAEVRVTALRGGTAVRGARCQWSLPTVVKPMGSDDLEELAQPVGARYTFAAGNVGGTGTARCWLPGSLFVDVPVTVN